MSRVIELQRDWMKDPAFVQEFAKLEAELRELKGVARGRAGKPAACENHAADSGVVLLSSRKRSA